MPPADFSTQEYQRLIDKYLALGRENDRLVREIRSGNQVDIGHIKQVLQTDFPLFARLQDYFSRLCTGDLKPVDQAAFVPEDPASRSSGTPSRSVDMNMEGVSEMQLESDHDLGAMSMFSRTEASAFAGKLPTVPNQGPFGIRFSDFPPRVISQMLSTHTDITASNCRCCSCISISVYPHHSSIASWRGSFTWAGFEHVSRAKKFMKVPMIGLNVTDGKDLYAKKKRLTKFAHTT